MVGFIRNQLRQAGFVRALLGLSGGIDSALVAFLVAQAVGPESMLCVLMPYRTSSPESVDHARLVVDQLGCASDLVDISPIVDGYFGRDGELGAGGEAASDAAPLRRGNFMARARMCVLYDRSVLWDGLVAGTGNKTESLIGYSTLFGDSACAFNPIGDLYKSQVRQVAAAIGVPEQIIRKAPSADLWPGQTDEAEAGFSYPELDRLLFWMIDKRRTDEELAAMGFPAPAVGRVKRLVAVSEFKRQVPPVAKLGPRTTGVDYLYPRRRPGSAR
jgi:NAD+ synthase